LIQARYRGDSVDEDALSKRVRACSTAEWLRSMGYEHEIDALLEFDSTETVPTLRDGVFVDS
jgi:hypothetical protein